MTTTNGMEVEVVTAEVLPPPSFSEILHAIQRRLQAAASRTALIASYDEVVEILAALDTSKRRGAQRRRRIEALEEELRVQREQYEELIANQRTLADKALEDKREEYNTVLAEQQVAFDRTHAKMTRALNTRDREIIALTEQLEQAREELVKAEQLTQYYADNASRRARRQQTRLVRDRS